MDVNPTVARLAPFEPPYAPELAAMLAKWMPPGSAAEPLKLFRTLAYNREVFDRMRPLGAGILGPKSSIEPRERELVIDRVCARCGCEYEWGVHVATFGQAVGISAEKLAATAMRTAGAALWTERERLLVGLVDELHDTARVSDELWQGLAIHWNPSQLIELLVMVGWYHLISFVANAAQVEPEAWAARFPKSEL